MQRIVQEIRVRPECIAEYRRVHENVPPAVRERIRRSNIANYSIHLLGDRLIGYFEYHGDDYEADMAAMAADEATQQWWLITDPMQEPLPEAGPGQHWATAEQVFLLEEQAGPGM
jgi:L-rhamnose mutarotase